jgi:hypothetical protein
MEALMARKARPGKGTVIRFISFDDSAIGGDPETKAERYREYLETAKVSLLELDREKEPAFYYLRPLGSREAVPLSQIHGAVLEKFKKRAAEIEQGKEEPDEQDVSEMKALDIQYDQVMAEVLEDCLVGCDSHQIVEGIDDDGDLILSEPLVWKIGTKPPAGLRRSIIDDSMIAHNMIRLLLTASWLTEKEKKLSV